MSVYRNETVVIERVSTPRGDIQLQLRGNCFEIIENGTYIMASYNGKSEKRLMDIVFERIAPNRPVDVLIGGLGLGYTLQAALKHPNVGRVTVVEIEKTIVDWNRKYFGALNGNALDHPKTDVVVEDLKSYLAASSNSHDVIALDVDNGPDWVVYNDNRAIYEPGFLKLIKRRISPGGVLTVWSATRSEEMFMNLGQVFSNVEVEKDEEENSFIFLSVNGQIFNHIQARHSITVV